MDLGTISLVIGGIVAALGVFGGFQSVKKYKDALVQIKEVVDKYIEANADHRITKKELKELMDELADVVVALSGIFKK